MAMHGHPKEHLHVYISIFIFSHLYNKGYCFVTMDSNSKGIENFIVNSTNTAFIMEKLSKTFAWFSLPRFVTLDGVTCFTSKRF